MLAIPTALHGVLGALGVRHHRRHVASTGGGGLTTNPILYSPALFTSSA